MHATFGDQADSIACRHRKSTPASPWTGFGGPSDTRVLVIDAERRLIRASLGGERLLSQERGLRLSLDRVRGVARGDDDALERAVALAARGGMIEQVMSLGPKGLGLSMSVVALFAPGRTAEILLMVRDAKEERRRALARAAAFFGFTGAETRLVSALFEGCSVPDAADRLGVAPTTARSHLQSVFSKTGVRRQGDLLALLTTPEPELAAA